ncbi:MAG: hypothetical protein FJ240_07885 [Nitrospira sp.]|nr:hypothetical protein [Nitrospira sp.]
MHILITSSPTTLRWLSKIVSEIKAEIPSLIYTEAKYWASFKSPNTNRNVVYLQPQKTQIRLFIRLELSHDTDLRQTPSSSGWAERYPSIFLIRSEEMIGKAIELIISSHEYDLHQ